MTTSTTSTSPPTRAVTFANDKGGVYKTSIVANVGGLVAAAGRRVLICDLDPQGNITEDLGFADRTDDGAALADSILTGRALQPLRDVRPNLDVTPGGLATGQVNEELIRSSSPLAARQRLAVALAPIAGEYDLILFDTPPKQPAIQMMAMAASRWLVIPTKVDASSRKGLRTLVGEFLSAKEVNASLELMGVVLVGLSRNATAMLADARADFAADLGEERMVLNAWIPESSGGAVRGRDVGQLVHEYAEDGSGRDSAKRLTADYMALATEILTRVAQGEAS